MSDLEYWLRDYPQMKEEVKELEAQESYGLDILAENTRARMEAVEQCVKSLPLCVERVYLQKVFLEGMTDSRDVYNAILAVLHTQALRMFRDCVRSADKKGSAKRAAEKSGEEERDSGVPCPAPHTP